eukprot:COSAG01_NODE_842_length_13174_cov_44.463250_17_plen_123_part_00
MCTPSHSGEAHSRPPPGTATRRPLTGRLCARAGPRLGRTDRGEGRPESSVVTTATCGHRAPSPCERPRWLLRNAVLPPRRASGPAGSPQTAGGSGPAKIAALLNLRTTDWLVRALPAAPQAE